MREEILFFKKQSVNELAKKAFLDRQQLVNIFIGAGNSAFVEIYFGFERWLLFKNS